MGVPSSSAGPWLALVVEVPDPLAEELSGGLAHLSLGSEFRPADRGRTELRIYLRTTDSCRAFEQELGRVLHGWGLDPATAGPRWIEVADEPWVERYQASLRPIPLGRKFLVFPTGGGGTSDERIPIQLAPGRAFGTGEHATTQLCVAALERWVRTGSHWLDVGCGTGILAMVAVLCGAPRVLALDVDREAIRVAVAALGDNSLAPRVDLAVGSVDAARREAWDGLVTNISTAFLLGSAPALASRLKPGGHLIASGFPVDDLPAVLDALAAAELQEVERRVYDPWAAVVVRSKRP